VELSLQEEMKMSDLSTKSCKPCEGGVAKLTTEQAQKMLAQLNDWSLSNDSKVISKHFKFNNYYETLAFVNTTAWISHRENHHPDLTVCYNTCTVNYMTHAIDGLSDNDFICAAKIDALLSA